MNRKCIIFAAVLFLAASGALADIGQMQGFSIGSLNLVGRCGTVGSAQGENTVVISHTQVVHKPYFSVKARQEEEGVLVQHGTAKGSGGVSGVAQRATVQGLQGQHTRLFGPKMQGQGLNLKLEQVAMKSYGVGCTQGEQSFVGGQSQTITTPHVTSTETQFVGVEQYSAVSGRRGSKGMVVNTVNVEMGQGQSITGLPKFPR
jgi:hypothetical protein